MVRKSRPSARRKPRKGEPSAEENGTDFDARLRVTGGRDRLPQGVAPAEKLAALEALAALHGVEPIQDPRTMVAPFWPPEEDTDEMVSALRELRRRGR